jgi:hypothetical protein
VLHTSGYTVGVNKKTCIKCDTEKLLDEFAFKCKAKGTRHSYCKLCFRKVRTDHYQQNKQETLRRIRTRNAEVRAKNQRLLHEYLLKHPCVDCGEPDPVVLEFDHIQGDKIKAVSVLLRESWSWQSILAEIQKCEVRCANCHRRVTARRGNHYRSQW